MLGDVRAKSGCLINTRPGVGKSTMLASFVPLLYVLSWMHVIPVYINMKGCLEKHHFLHKGTSARRLQASWILATVMAMAPLTG